MVPLSLWLNSEIRHTFVSREVWIFPSQDYTDQEGYPKAEPFKIYFVMCQFDTFLPWKWILHFPIVFPILTSSSVLHRLGPCTEMNVPTILQSLQDVSRFHGTQSLHGVKYTLRWGQMGRQAATCCSGLKEKRITGKGLRKVGKGQSSHSFECQIKESGHFKQAHEVIVT